MKTLPLINITHADEVNPPRKISNEEAEDKIKSVKDDKTVQKTAVVSSPIAPFNATSDERVSPKHDDIVDILQQSDHPTDDKVPKMKLQKYFIACFN